MCVCVCVCMCVYAFVCLTCVCASVHIRECGSVLYLGMAKEISILPY